MKKEIAIDILDDNFTVINAHGHYTDEEVEQARQMAIKTLEQELKQELKQEPCDDCISRKEMLKYQEYLHGKMSNEENHKLWEFIKGLPSVTPQGPNTWSLDDAREDFMSDVYNTLDFLPTNDEANQIIDSFDSVTSGIRQESILDKIRAKLIEEKEYAYADFERYKVEYLGQDLEDALDSIPQDDFRYGVERCIEIIDKCKAESEG